jgi:hypothetical protein
VTIALTGAVPVTSELVIGAGGGGDEGEALLPEPPQAVNTRTTGNANTRPILVGTIEMVP